MKSKKLTTKRFLFTDGPFVIAHLDPDLFIIKTVEDRITAMNMVRYSTRGKDSWWVYCGNGQAGWTAAIEQIAYELHRQAQICSEREAHEARQYELFGRVEDEATDHAITFLNKYLG